jgi:hypothetical protein
MIGLMVPNIHAELYHDNERGFSINYPNDWWFDDFMIVSKSDTLVSFLYVDEKLHTKADISLLYEQRGDLDGYTQDYIHSIILFRDVTNLDHSDETHAKDSREKPIEILTENEEDTNHLSKLFASMSKDCQLLKLEWEEMSCVHRKLIESDVIVFNGNKAYKIVYSWTELNEVCKSVQKADRLVISCQNIEYENLSTTIEFKNNEKIWRINSKIRMEEATSLSSQVDDIINSLKFLDRNDTKTSVPDWIKNNAGWWYEGKLDDATFTNGIKFLIDDYVIQLEPEISSINDVGKISLKKNAFNLKDYQGGITPVNIFGVLNDFHESYRLKIEITRPDKQIDSFRILPTESGFEYTYELKNDFPMGKYIITGLDERENKKLAPLTFTVNLSDKSKQIPQWVKNNAGWWAENLISEKEFLSSIEYLVNNGIIFIDVEKNDSKFVKSTDLISSTKILSDANYFEVFLIYASQGNECTPEERKSAAEYGYLSEYLLEKNLRGMSTKVETICMPLSEIKESHYPLVLAKLGSNKPHMLIFVGDIKANFESYYDYGAYGWWAVIPTYSPKFTDAYTDIQMIVVCECDKRYVDQKAGGMWTLAHEIAHYNLYEQKYSAKVYGDNVHWVEYLYRECTENDTLDTKDCRKLYETVDVLGTEYQVMDIIYLKTDWKEIQNSISREVLDNREE